MEALLTTESLIAFLTLAGLEIVLGIDNIVFIAIMTGRLPKDQRSSARKVGLLAAMITRILLLLALGWVMRLTAPLFELLSHPFSGRDLILLGGGLFLIAKATHEIHEKLEEANQPHDAPKAAKRYWPVIVQIMFLDLIFSLDSVITAIGMASQIAIMIAAVMAAIIVMMFFANPLSDFVEHHPTLKMLALSFLILIGVMLMMEGLGKHVDKGYIYFAMGFSLAVEFLNMRLGRRASARSD